MSRYVCAHVPKVVLLSLLRSGTVSLNDPRARQLARLASQQTLGSTGLNHVPVVNVAIGVQTQVVMRMW